MSGAQIDLFENKSPYAAVVRLALPAVVGQIILVLYNMADTFFVGLTRSDANVTAVTVCMPALMFLLAIANLFGVGGGAAFSRALGRRDLARCGNIAAHALLGCLLGALLYGVLCWLFLDAFADLLGAADPAVHALAARYLAVTVALGGVPTALSALFAHLVRAEGRSAQSSCGTILGGVLNMALDPLFMFVLLPRGNEVLGAAIATALSNLLSCLYFLAILRRGRTSLRFRYDRAAFSDGSARELLLTGLPACLMTLFENMSYAILSVNMAHWGVAAQAGTGVAKKINMLAHCAVRGIAQGVLPLLAYAFASGNRERMRRFLRISITASVSLSTLLMGAYLLFSQRLAGLFLPAGKSQDLCAGFLRILCVGCPFSALGYTVISFFQAVNQGGKSFLLACLRKGAVDIPLMFLLKTCFGARGLIMATPLADMLCCVTAVLLLGRWFYEPRPIDCPCRPIRKGWSTHD